MDITRLLGLQTEAARDPRSELARILAYSPAGGSVDSMGVPLGFQQQPAFGISAPQQFNMANVLGNGPAYPQMQQQQAQSGAGGQGPQYAPYLGAMT